MSDITLRYVLLGEDKSATSTVGKVGGAFHKLGGVIGGELGQVFDQVGTGIDEIGKHATSMGAKITGVGALVTGLGVGLQAAGSKDKAAAEQLSAAIGATGQSASDYKEAIDKAIKANENYGHGAADTQTALMNLTAATNDPKKALSEMSVVANLAAAKHISLADASTQVAKILGGSGARTLAQYGIHMATTGDKTKNAQDALDLLSGKLKGQASASVDSFGGKVTVAKTKLGDWTAEIGQKFGPALTVMGPVLLGVGSIMEIVKARQLAAAAATEADTVANGQNVIARVAQGVATAAVTVATGIWTAAQWALNVALSANPIALVILGIIALIAVIILAWKHSETFRTIVIGAFHAVLSAVSATWGWVKSHWPLLLAILTGPVGLAVLWITKHWGQITTFFKGVPKALGQAVAGVASFLTAPFISAFNTIADAWNNTIGRLHWSVPGWVPGIGGDSISAPTLPHFASGVSGVINRPGMFMAGEGGAPEAISITPLGAGRNGGGGDVYNITVNGALDADAVGVQIERVLVKRKGRQGRLAFQ